MEIRMNQRHNWVRGKYGRAEFSLCATGFRRVIDIPKNATGIVAVFSKTDVKPEASLTINKPTIMPTWFGNPNRTPISTVRETRASYGTDTKKMLATAYNKGYRFVRFEYA